MLESFFRKFPEINLGDVVLRDVKLSDDKAYFELLADAEVAQYQSDEDLPKTVEEALEDVRYYGSAFYHKRSIFWTIADVATDRLIGMIGFTSWNMHNRRAEISYDLHKDYWRRGIMSRALHKVVPIAFGNMYIERIEARTMLHNAASQGLLEKIGFKREGTLRKYRMIRGNPTDILLYSLVKEDYPHFLLHK